MSAAAEASSALQGLFSEARVERLDNGLTVCLHRNPQAPVVTTSIWYRAGARDEPVEPAELGGIAHFLEHMMFKGSRRYAAGEIDGRTRRLGGSNNAFTSHDATSYYFSFSRDHWTEALEIEADRMAGLTLDPAEIDAERRVVLEEIAMYEGDPWVSLELAVQAAFYGDHPYGRSVLGSRESLARIGRDELSAFHSASYTPANAVLVVAGDLDDSALAEVERRFGSLGQGGGPVAAATDAAAAAPGRAGAAGESGHLRVEQRRGETPRFLLALPAPPAEHEDFVPLSLALAVLAGGRASRLQRALVEEGRLCSSVSADATEMAGPAMTLVAAEALPSTALEEVEEVVVRELRRLGESVPAVELDRARRLFFSDWLFALDRISQQALVLGSACTLFDLDYPRRFARRVAETGVEEVVMAARRYLDPGSEEEPRIRAVTGWSVPRS